MELFSGEMPFESNKTKKMNGTVRTIKTMAYRKKKRMIPTIIMERARARREKEIIQRAAKKKTAKPTC